MSKPYVVFLNGPPGSGKDYAADVLMHDSGLHVETHKFAAPIKRSIAILCNTSVRAMENNKTKVMLPYGVTGRQMMIDFSDKWMKPAYGKDIFGKILAEHIGAIMQMHEQDEKLGLTGKPDETGMPVGNPDLFVITDSGFDYEAEHVLKLFGNDNALLIRLHRDGHTFDGDSRSYIEMPDVHTIDFVNCGTDDFAKRLISNVKNWMKEKNNG
mgnify:CR=1 FL=1